MSEILLIFHQSPPPHYQMHSHLQQGRVHIESQFNRSFESGFPWPDVTDHFQCYEFAGSLSVDELSKVTAIIERNQNLRKRKLEVMDSHQQRVDCDLGLTGPPEARRCIEDGHSKPNMDLKPELDYVHVRARRGQATDNHSLAERARREKIKKKMQYLQDLVPGCNRLTNKTAILDEIITYVQCLQRDVESGRGGTGSGNSGSVSFMISLKHWNGIYPLVRFLTMKLAALSACVDFNMDNLLLDEQQLQLPSGRN